MLHNRSLRRVSTAVGAVLAATALLVTGCTAAGTWTDTAPKSGGFGYYATALTDVSCAAADACVGVGPSSASVWNGQAWADTALPVSAQVSTVACGAVDVCFANPTLTSDSREVPLSRLVGTRWLPADDPDAVLTGTMVTDLDCAGERFCLAALSRAGVPEIARWDGTSWSRTPTPSAPKGTLRLSCAAEDECLATATGMGTASAFVWYGDAWEAIAAPPIAVDTLTCGDGICLVSGSDGTTARLARWDGERWSDAPLPTEPVAALDCVSATWCLALTAGPNRSGQVFDGAAWRRVALPGSAAYATFTTVSCAGPDRCLAGGSRLEGDLTHRAVIWWNGNGWSDKPDVPRPTRSAGRLQSVSCPADLWCAAVGTGYDGHQAVPIAQVWDGTTWKVTPLPAVLPDGDLDVSCASPTFCMAVGVAAAGSSGRNRALRWDGTSWQPIDLTPVLTGVGPARVSCPTPTFCLAGGSGAMLRFDGSQWSAQTAPAGTVRDIDCVRVNLCRATGFGTGGIFEPVFDTFDGVGWVAGALPVIANRNAWGEQLSCVDDQHCIAVGRASRAVDPLILAFNGTVWTGTTLAPNRTDAAVAVDCVDAKRCLAVTSSAGMEQATTFIAADVANPASWLPAAAMPHGDNQMVIAYAADCRPKGCMVVGYQRSNYDSGEKTYAARLTMPPPGATTTTTTTTAAAGAAR
jgi:hypothetical protein